MSPALQQMRDRLLALHPDWEHRMYSDDDCRELVAKKAPYLLAAYDAYKHPIQRIDLWRMVAVQTYGGFYLDLDMVVHRALDDLRILACVFAEEKTMDEASLFRHGHRPGDGMRVANYMFGARASHEFFALVLERIAQSVRPIHSANDILESTGPGLVTQVYHDYAAINADTMTVLRSPGALCPICHTTSCQFGDYATHLHMGSWRF